MSVLLYSIGRSGANAWTGRWMDAWERAGARPRRLTVAAVLASPRGPGTVVYVQWPELLLVGRGRPRATASAARLALAVLLGRARGNRVLYTAHNVQGHDDVHRGLERALDAVLDRAATDLHVFSEAGAQEVLRARPGLRRARRWLVRHGDYRDPEGQELDRAKARADVGLPERAWVVLHFGGLRPYKGVEDLADAFDAYPDHDAVLAVVGGCGDAGLRRRLERLAAGDPRVHLRLQRVDDDELRGWVRAADLVVLPYRRVLNSGAAVLALGEERPLLVPRTPTFLELDELTGSGYVRTYTGPLGPDDLAGARRPEPQAPPELGWACWQEVERRLRTFLQAAPA